MESESIETTLTHMENNVCVTETDCDVELEFSTSWEENFNGERFLVVDDVVITAFVFRNYDGLEKRARIEKGKLGFDYFTAIADIQQITEVLCRKVKDQE